MSQRKFVSLVITTILGLIWMLQGNEESANVFIAAGLIILSSND